MSDMADVLARRNFEAEFDDGRDWAALPEMVKLGWRTEAQETLDFLSAAGFGPVQEARATWDKGYEVGREGYRGALAQAWDEGKEAGMLDYHNSANPYREDT